MFFDIPFHPKVLVLSTILPCAKRHHSEPRQGVILQTYCVRNYLVKVFGDFEGRQREKTRHEAREHESTSERPLCSVLVVWDNFVSREKRKVKMCIWTILIYLFQLTWDVTRPLFRRNVSTVHEYTRNAAQYSHP